MLKLATGFKNVVVSAHVTVILSEAVAEALTDVGALGEVLVTADDALEVVDDTEFTAVTV